MMKFFLSILFLSFTLLPTVFSQEHYFRQYAAEEGLQHTYIYTLNQGVDGFMWIGTAEGLYKFNGLDFEYFTKEDGLAGNFIIDSYKDKSGILWFGHQNGSISGLIEDKFITLNENALIPGSVNDLTEDGRGFLWASVQNQGLLYFDKEGEITQVGFSLENELISQIAYMGNDYFLIGCQEHLYLSQFERDSGSMKAIKRIEAYPESKVLEILPDSSSSYIILSQLDGIYSFTFDSLSAHFECSVVDDNSDGLLDNLQGGLLDYKGSLWLNSMGRGLIKYSRNHGSFIRERVLSTQNGLVSDNVRSLFEDFEGNLWLGMYGEGLLRYSGSNLISYNYSTENETNRAHAITGYKGKLLLVSDHHLLLLNQNGDSLLNASPLPVNTFGDKLNTAYLDKDEKLWLGFEQSGLYASGPSNFEFKAVFISENILANSVNHITGTKDFLWVSTKRGICRINRASGESRWFTSENGLSHNNIQQLYIDSKGRVLIATLCKEIHYINDQDKVAILDNSRIGPQNTVMSLLEDTDGNIWVGTLGNGIWKLMEEDFVQITRASGLLSNFCYSLALTREGDLMISHRGGISRIGLESGRINTLSRLEGIKSSTEFYPNAVLNDELGNIWFGTSEGLLSYSNCSSKGDQQAPILHINALYIDGEETDYRAGLIVLKPGFHEIRIEYNGLHFSNPEMVLYQTKLLGYNSDWSEPTSSRAIVYERLEHGHYSFMIRAFNENDIGSKLSSAFEIKIKKPIFLRVWFYVIIAFLLGFSFYMTIRIRERYHRRVKEKLLKNLDDKTKEIIVKEEIIKERKKVEKILIEAKTKAEQSDKLKTSFLQNMSHEIRTPMNAIVGFSQLLKEESLSPQDRNRFVENVSINAGSLLQLIDNILDLSKLESNQLEIEKGPCLVNPLMDELEHTFLRHLQKVDSLDIHLIKKNTGADNLELFTDSKRLKQILFHLLDNAIKFTEKGTVTFGYNVEDSKILFYVEDTGIGLTEDKKNVVFDLFRKVEDDRFKLYGGTGLGLTLAKYLVNMMGGKIDVDSKKDVGSKFYFYLPLSSTLNQTDY
jgi:signal transduction histidine kinase/sugar lactone lactonase YvrE